MATWAKGLDFKNSNNTLRVGGVGVYGTDKITNKIYIGLGEEPWNNNGLEITESTITFKGNKVLTSVDKISPESIGALPLSGGTMTGEINLGGKTLRLSSDYSGYARIGVEASSGDVYIGNINNNWFRIKPDKTITIAGQKVYTALDKPTPADIGALPLTGGTMSGNLVLKKQQLLGANNTVILRDHGNGNVTLSAGTNTEGATGDLYLGYNTATSYKTNNVRLERPLTWKGTKTLINENGYIPWTNIIGKPTPSEIGASDTSHNHDSNYLKLSGGTISGQLSLTGNLKTSQYLQIGAWANYGTGTLNLWFNNKDGVGELTSQELKNIKLGNNYVYHTGHKPSPSDIGAAASNHNHSLVSLNSMAFAGGNNLDSFNSDKTWVGRTINTTASRPMDYCTVVNFGANGNSNGQLAWNYSNTELDLRFRKRHDVSGTYGAWRKIYHEGHKPTPAEIGAMAEGGTYSTIKLTDWIRTVGNSGWYSQTYDGGWYMSDNTWIRAYNNKSVYTGGTIRADRSILIGDGSKFRVLSTGAIETTVEAHFSSGAYSDPLSGVACAIKAKGNMATDNMYAQYYKFNTTSNYINGRTGGGYDFWFGDSGNRITFDGTNHRIYRVTSAGVWTVIAG